jgi:hypothetical protein
MPSIDKTAGGRKEAEPGVSNAASYERLCKQLADVVHAVVDVEVYDGDHREALAGVGMHLLMMAMNHPGDIHTSTLEPRGSITDRVMMMSDMLCPGYTDMLDLAVPPGAYVEWEIALKEASAEHDFYSVGTLSRFQEASLSAMMAGVDHGIRLGAHLTQALINATGITHTKDQDRYRRWASMAERERGIAAQ